MNIKPPRSLGLRPAATGLEALEYEVMQEKAATLGRLARNFERALAALVAFERSEASAAEIDDGRHERLLEEAGEALWCFVVQREACGLRGTEAVLREYSVPAAVRLRLGVAGRPR